MGAEHTHIMSEVTNHLGSWVTELNQAVASDPTEILSGALLDS
jgi:hypothetical protein